MRLQFEKEVKYEDRIDQMVEEKGCRLIISLNDILAYDNSPNRERFHGYVLLFEFEYCAMHRLGPEEANPPLVLRC